MAEKRMELVKWFSELSGKDVNLAGEKGARLADLHNNKFPVPAGFVVTTDAYNLFMQKSGILQNILRMLDETDVNNISSLQRTSSKIRDIILGLPMPAEIEDAVSEAYDILDIDRVRLERAGPSALDILKTSHEPPFVAVRGSCAIDGLEGGFTGQTETYLSVKGNEQLIKEIKKCFASLFTSQAIYYRQRKGIVHQKASAAVIVQKMIDAEKSGVIYSKNILEEGGNVLVESVWGIGSGLASGKVSPDRHLLNTDLKILEAKIGDKGFAVTRNSSGKVDFISLTSERSSRQVLSEYEVKRLAQFSLSAEELYKAPQEMEFAVSDNELYVLQARSLATTSKREKDISGKVITSGLAASGGIVTGNARLVHDTEELMKINSGEIIVADFIDSSHAPMLQRAGGIIMGSGGASSRAVALMRDLGMPAVVSAKNAIDIIRDGELITIDGYSGRIIQGAGESKSKKVDPIIPTKTKVRVISLSPDYAETAASSGAMGAGLVTIEGIISETKKHPAWYVMSNSNGEYISSIYYGLKKISSCFNEVWVRTLDLKSHEGAKLEGGNGEVETNPLLGDHGIRFSLKNQDILESEIKAIKEIADESSEKKFGIMLAHLVSVEELREAKKIINFTGVPENVSLGATIETPAAALMIEELCNEGISFVHVGLDELTQYTLAIDHSNESVNSIYDEAHPSILSLLKRVILTCKRKGVEVSVSGRAVSNPIVLGFLAREKVDSITVNAEEARNISMKLKDAESQVPVAIDEGSQTMEVEELRQEARVETSANEINNHIEKAKDASWKSQVYEEELILKALEDSPDEYQPSFHKDEKGMIPQLNEAIPISSETLAENKEEYFNLEPVGIFERQSEDELERSVNLIIERNKEEEAATTAMKEREGNREENGRQPQEMSADELLDIF